jgi:signal transduction histidine kinase
MAKLLLVDDREDNLMSIESILLREDYTFVKASSGRQALKILLNEFDFALILMDVNMPTLDGFETARMIYEREKLKHIPIIFITAHHLGDDSVFKGYRTGAVDYIYKPINPDLLRAKVSVFIDLYQKNHQLRVQEQKLMVINKNLAAEISERKNSEEKVRALNLQLLETIDKIEAANKELDRFAFMASHDLQEPLRKIRIFCSRLSEKYDNLFDDEARLYLSRMQNSTDRMQQLIQDILTFSKISFEKKEFVNSDLNVILQDTLVDLDMSIKDKQAQIISEKLPELCINPNLVRPLFFNLIGNALKYSKADTPPIIKIYADINNTTGNKYCRIFFNDNGIGFDQKYSEQIFGMFTRLHPKNEYEGTGVGLALCKKIVEEHEGYISAISTTGVGSTFIVSFPLTLKETKKNGVRLSKN